MSKKRVADKKFLEALKAINESGESAVNYCLSYVRGQMDAQGNKHLRHDWDDSYMSIDLKKEHTH